MVGQTLTGPCVEEFTLPVNVSWTHPTITLNSCNLKVGFLPLKDNLNSYPFVYDGYFYMDALINYDNTDPSGTTLGDLYLDGLRANNPAWAAGPLSVTFDHGIGNVVLIKIDAQPYLNGVNSVNTSFLFDMNTIRVIQPSIALFEMAPGDSYKVLNKCVFTFAPVGTNDLQMVPYSLGNPANLIVIPLNSNGDADFVGETYTLHTAVAINNTTASPISAVDMNLYWSLNGQLQLAASLQQATIAPGSGNTYFKTNYGPITAPLDLFWTISNAFLNLDYPGAP